MLSSASIAQLLPLHIVESIVDYARATHRVNYKNDKQAALSIIHSCQAWRSVFLRRACSSIFFEISTSASHEFIFTKCPDVFSPLSHPTVQHIKHLNIGSKSWGPIMDGSLLTWMLETGVSDLLFPSIESLQLSICDTNYSSALSEESIIVAVQNIEAFLQLIRTMVPNVKCANVAWSNVAFSKVNQNLVSLISNIAADYLYGMCRFRLDSQGVISNPTQLVPECTSGLTHIDLLFSFNYTRFTELICHNSGTLVSLKIFLMKNTHYKSLLQNNSSEPIVYPFLKFLKLEQFRYYNLELPMTDATFESTSNDTDHFPMLESFYISCEFPFISNVFMLGKNTTLRHLTAIFYSYRFAENNTVFQKYARTQFCNLSSINISGVSSMSQSDSIFDSQIEFLRSTLSHSTNVQKISYFGITNKCRFFREAQNSSIFQSLRILAIRDIILSFSDIVVLLQNSALLESLECGIDKKAPKIDGIGPNKLPSYISGIQPLGKWIRMIKLSSGFRGPIKYIAKIAILLAIGCPRLSKISCFRNIRDSIYEEIDNISKTKLFNDYAEQCRSTSSKIHFY